MDNKLKLYKDTIRNLLDELKKPASEVVYIDKLELIEAGEIVLAGVER